jgi:hypothetical protein
MNAPLVFMDTETTGLALTDDIWEFAAIRRDPDGTETTAHIFIEHDRDKCRNLPSSFRDDHYARFRDHQAYTRRYACQVITDVFRNGRPHVVGAVPNFDTERIAQFVAKQWPHWPPLGWHYHLIDVETLAVGYLHAQAREFPGGKAADFVAKGLPWDSDDLTAALGLDPVPENERHTALGDARWVMRIYDAVTGGES